MVLYQQLNKTTAKEVSRFCKDIWKSKKLWPDQIVIMGKCWAAVNFVQLCHDIWAFSRSRAKKRASRGMDHIES